MSRKRSSKKLIPEEKEDDVEDVPDEPKFFFRKSTSDAKKVPTDSNVPNKATKMLKPVDVYDIPYSESESDSDDDWPGSRWVLKKMKKRGRNLAKEVSRSSALSQEVSRKTRAYERNRLLCRQEQEEKIPTEVQPGFQLADDVLTQNSRLPKIQQKIPTTESSSSKNIGMQNCTIPVIKKENILMEHDEGGSFSNNILIRKPSLPTRPAKAENVAKQVRNVPYNPQDNERQQFRIPSRYLKKEDNSMEDRKVGSSSSNPVFKKPFLPTRSEKKENIPTVARLVTYSGIQKIHRPTNKENIPTKSGEVGGITAQKHDLLTKTIPKNARGLPRIIATENPCLQSRRVKTEDIETEPIKVGGIEVQKVERLTKKENIPKNVRATCDLPTSITTKKLCISSDHVQQDNISTKSSNVSGKEVQKIDLLAKKIPLSGRVTFNLPSDILMKKLCMPSDRSKKDNIPTKSRKVRGIEVQKIDRITKKEKKEDIPLSDRVAHDLPSNVTTKKLCIPSDHAKKDNIPTQSSKIGGIEIDCLTKKKNIQNNVGAAIDLPNDLTTRKLRVRQIPTESSKIDGIEMQKIDRLTKKKNIPTEVRKVSGISDDNKTQQLDSYAKKEHMSMDVSGVDNIEMQELGRQAKKGNKPSKAAEVKIKETRGRSKRGNVSREVPAVSDSSKDTEMEIESDQVQRENVQAECVSENDLEIQKYRDNYMKAIEERDADRKMFFEAFPSARRGKPLLLHGKDYALNFADAKPCNNEEMDNAKNSEFKAPKAPPKKRKITRKFIDIEKPFYEEFSLGMNNVLKKEPEKMIHPMVRQSLPVPIYTEEDLKPRPPRLPLEPYFLDEQTIRTSQPIKKVEKKEEEFDFFVEVGMILADFSNFEVYPVDLVRKLKASPENLKKYTHLFGNLIPDLLNRLRQYDFDDEGAGPSETSNEKKPLKDRSDPEYDHDYL